MAPEERQLSLTCVKKTCGHCFPSCTPRGRRSVCSSAVSGQRRGKWQRQKEKKRIMKKKTAQSRIAGGCVDGNSSLRQMREYASGPECPLNNSKWDTDREILEDAGYKVWPYNTVTSRSAVLRKTTPRFKFHNKANSEKIHYFEIPNFCFTFKLSLFTPL